MKYIGLNSSSIKVLWNWALVYCSTIGEISVFGHINEMGHSSVLQRMGVRGRGGYLLIGVLIEPKQCNIVLPLVKCYTSPWSLEHFNEMATLTSSIWSLGHWNEMATLTSSILLPDRLRTGLVNNDMKGGRKDCSFLIVPGGKVYQGCVTLSLLSDIVYSRWKIC